MEIKNDIFYVGVNDHDIDLFESQYTVKNGMAYNSYVIKDEKIAVMDSVDAHFGKEWLSNLKSVIGDTSPDYLIVQHMEPDHSGSLSLFIETYPSTVIVASAKAFQMMKQFYNEDLSARQIVVTEGSTLPLGKHTLHFVTAPMVHWPEVIMTYDDYTKTMFTADAFGKFGALDVEEDWTSEARRYYIGIVGKYGMQVQNLLKKAAKLEIEAICSLHGPMLTENLSKYLNLYNLWSSYTPEEKGVTIAFTSVYGNTRKAAYLLYEQLKEKGVNVEIFDLARCDESAAVASAFRFDKLVLATTTYNTEIFPFMNTYIHALVERNFTKRTVGFIENGSWAPMAMKNMMKLLENSKDLTYTENNVKILSGVSPENENQIALLAEELAK